MSAVELARLFKERDNNNPLGPVVGIVVSPPPAIQVSLGDKILLDSSDLIIASKVLEGYERKVSIDGVSTTDPLPISKIEGNLIYKDTLKPGDSVILVPSADEQTYFLIDRAVSL